MYNTVSVRSSPSKVQRRIVRNLDDVTLNLDNSFAADTCCIIHVLQQTYVAAGHSDVILRMKNKIVSL